MGKHLQKTIICLLLCAAILASNCHAVFATGIDALTDGQAAQNEYTEAQPKANVPDMSDSAKKTVTLQSGLDTDQPDSGELFSLFVEQKLYDQGIATFGIGARKNLNAVEQTIYDALKARIQAVAINGGSTVFTLSEISGLKTRWTNTELGVSSIEDLSIIAEAFLSQFNLDAIISALLSDCPFDLYWYDRTNTGGVEMSFQIEQTAYDNGVQIIYDTASVTGLTFTFAVAAEYMSGENTVTSDVAKITTVKNNAAQVVADNAGKTDFEKLLAYKTYICSAVSYDWSAAEDSTTPYGNPWQLISVFDGDTSTNVVCEGYSKAFMYLCDLTTFTGDICCYTVTGQMDGGNHMWNIVTMEGVNYLVDVTNSDSGTVGEAGGLFLAGGVGSVTEGYVVAGQSYVYDASTLDLWGADADSILILSDKDRQPSTDDDLAELTWHLDKTTGTLTISGMGPMRDFYDAGAPWYADHESVKSVVIEPGVTSIGASAFYGCGNLTNITIPSTVTTIGNRAFACCENLTSLVIPKNVTSIGNEAFIRCEALRKINFVGNAPAIGADAFGPNDGESWECVVATAHYPVDNETWSKDVLQNYGGTITWQTTKLPTCTEDGYTIYTYSGGDTYTGDYVSKLGHDMGQWTVVKEATPSAKGEEKRTCSRCDYMETRELEYKGPSDDETIKVKHNLTLESAIDFSFYVPKSAVAASGLTATIVQDRADGYKDKTITLNQADWETLTSGGVEYWRIRYTDVAAKEMTDILTLIILDASGVVVTDTYSVAAYAKERIEKSTNDKMKNLMNALLQYGAAAQVYFNYRTDALANAGLIAPAAATLTVAANAGTAVKHNLTLESNIDFSFFVPKSAVAASGLTATVVHDRIEGFGDKTVALDQAAWETFTSGGVEYWRIRYADIAAKEIGDTLKLTVFNGSDAVVIDSYSVLQYAQNRVQSSNNANMKALMQTLQTYGAAAQLYFNYK